MTPEHSKLIEDAKKLKRGKKNRPCVVLRLNSLASYAEIALLCTFDGEDIQLVDPVYRSFSLGVFPTEPEPKCPEGDYALGGHNALHTSPEWKAPKKDADSQELKKQWVLAFPLTLSGPDIQKIRPYQPIANKASTVVERQAELPRFRGICRTSHDVFLERFDTPAKLQVASATFMVSLLLFNAHSA